MSWDGVLGTRALNRLRAATGLDIVFANADHPHYRFVTADHQHGEYNTGTGEWEMREPEIHNRWCYERWPNHDRSGI